MIVPRRWTVLICLPCVLSVAITHGVATGAPIKSLEDGKTGTIEFESLTFPLSAGTALGLMVRDEDAKPVVVSGELKIPRGAAPRGAAVLLMHGCSGITGVQENWTRLLSGMNFVTFLVDSFDGRKIKEVCTGGARISTLSQLADAYRALALVVSHPRVDPARIALMGFSFGGRTTLWASYARFRTRWTRGAGPQFVAYLSFYPAVSWYKLVGDEEITDRPIRVFQGAADDWTPLAPIDAYVGRLRTAGRQNISLIVYEFAHHGFDNPRGAYPPRRYEAALNLAACTFVEQPNGEYLDSSAGRPAGLDSPCISRGVTTGYNPQALEKATKDVKAFLHEVFQLK